MTNALNGTTNYAYNLAGWQTSETDPDNNVTQYGYNNAGEMTSETNPLGYQQTFGLRRGRAVDGTDGLQRPADGVRLQRGGLEDGRDVVEQSEPVDLPGDLHAMTTRVG